MRVARQFQVIGRVQGVGFRYFVRDAALREGVTGWIRNRRDGTVEARLEGEEASVTRVERMLRQGPRGARVDTVTRDSDNPSGAFHTFTITESSEGHR